MLLRIAVFIATAGIHASAALGVAASLASAQPPLRRVDSALVARILLAEDSRDSAYAALRDGTSHRDARVRALARRAVARIRDPRFAARDSFAPLPAPPNYSDAAWRVRYRALQGARTDCAAMEQGLKDAEWPVRLRAADVMDAACASNPAIHSVLAQWVESAPRSSARSARGVSWHAAGHGIVALARLDPAAARAALPRIAGSPIPALRMYGARAAAVLRDATTLRALARDANDNVKEVAIDSLARLAGSRADDEYLAALGATGYQAVRAGARALRGSPRGAEVAAAAIAAARRLQRDSSETSRDARAALLDRIDESAGASDARAVAELAHDFDCVLAGRAAAIATRLGRSPVAPRCEPLAISVPPEAVALALGGEVRIRVVLADSSGGGAFTLRVRGDLAPIMAARVLALVRSGAYDGRAWYRVEHDFVIQGGGPGSNEYAGFPRYMRDELGTVPHVRGTVGMSTRGHDTGDAQWFVNLRDNLRLGRDYTVFGEVVEGIEVVDGILEGDVIARMTVVR